MSEAKYQISEEAAHYEGETLAAAIAERNQLRARVAELEARERWVPVGERLPEEKTAVVVRRGDGTIGAVSTCRICGKFHSIVTHWRSLPEGPKDTDLLGSP